VVCCKYCCIVGAYLKNIKMWFLAHRNAYQEKAVLLKLTLFAVSPFLAILSAPTTARRMLTFLLTDGSCYAYRLRVCSDVETKTQPWYRKSSQRVSVVSGAPRPLTFELRIKIHASEVQNKVYLEPWW